jgi:hypothetical protein
MPCMTMSLQMLRLTQLYHLKVNLGTIPLLHRYFYQLITSTLPSTPIPDKVNYYNPLCCRTDSDLLEPTEFDRLNHAYGHVTLDACASSFDNVCSNCCSTEKTFAYSTFTGRTSFINPVTDATALHILEHFETQRMDSANTQAITILLQSSIVGTPPSVNHGFRSYGSTNVSTHSRLALPFLKMPHVPHTPLQWVPLAGIPLLISLTISLKNKAFPSLQSALKTGEKY